MTVYIERKPLVADKPVVILDCDGVLLKWQANLPYFTMPTKAILDCIVDEKFRPATELFGVDDMNHALQLMRMYNESVYAECLPAYTDAMELLNDPEVHELYQFVMVSSFDSGDISRNNRAWNLDSLFPNAFAGYCFAPLMSDKVGAFRYVKQKAATFGTWVDLVCDDQPRYLEDARTVFGNGVPVYIQRTKEPHPSWEHDTDILYGINPLKYFYGR